jgi:hypothetical protein
MHGGDGGVGYEEEEEGSSDGDVEISWILCHFLVKKTKLFLDNVLYLLFIYLFMVCQLLRMYVVE